MIEKAQKSDLAEIVGLIIQMYAEGGYDRLFRDNAPEFILKTYEDLYDNAQAQHFIIRDEGKIVSTAGAFIKSDMLSSFTKDMYYGFISNVYTIPEYRDKGHATLLTQGAINWLKEKGMKEIKLVSTEMSKKIYEKMGFVPTDEMVMTIVE